MDLMNKSMTKENMLVLLDKINTHDTDLNIQILGGEPSIYKHIEYFVNNLDARHDLNFITNGVKTHALDLTFNNPKSSMMLSIHYEYLNEEYFQNIKRTILKYEKYILLSINIPALDIIEKYGDELLNFIERITTIADISYSTNNIIIDLEDINNHYDDFTDKVKALIPGLDLNCWHDSFEINGELSTVPEVTEAYYNLNINHNFKNKCICEMGFMEVLPDLELKYLCIDEHICSAKDFKIPDYPKKVLCPQDLCNYHCYTNNTKWFI